MIINYVRSNRVVTSGLVKPKNYKEYQAKFVKAQDFKELSFRFWETSSIGDRND